MDGEPTWYRITRWQRFVSALRSWLTHPLPRSRWTAYGLEGEERICIWKQWGTRCRQVLDFTTGKPFSYHE